jgi:hypothetical protein
MLMRVDHNRTVKILFNTEAIRIRKTGRPKLRWEDDVIQDIKTLGVKKWRNIAMEKGRAEASEEGQGPHRAVEPMMMIMMMMMTL